MSSTLSNEDAAWYSERPVFLTGGSGFIGTHLVDALSTLGARIVSLDLRAPMLPKQHDHWVAGDLRDKESLRAVLSAAMPEVVFNLAAETDLSKGKDAFSVNTSGLQLLLDACKSLPRKPQIIHFSTQLAVQAGYTPANDEDLRPHTAYGESKAESERIIRCHGRGLRWTIVRPTTVWGPFHPSMATTTWKYLRRGWYLVPNHAATRSYGYVGNVVQQLLKVPVAAPSKVDGEMFYLGDAPVPSTDWLDGFSVALRGKPTRRLPYPVLWLLALGGEVSGRIGGPSPINFGRLQRMSSDHPVPMDKTFEVLGNGTVSFEEGLADTLIWLEEQRVDR